MKVIKGGKAVKGGPMKKVNLSQKEKAIEAYLVRRVREMGGKAYKFTSPGNRAVPDRIVIMPGLMPVFAELKADGGVVSKLQRAEIQILLDLGQNACVCVGKTGVDELLNLLAQKMTEAKNDQ